LIIDSRGNQLLFWLIVDSSRNQLLASLIYYTQLIQPEIKQEWLI